MYSLKSLSVDAIPLALDKAERYRLLNQPWAAESICLDILSGTPGHQHALRVLLLACTDQFESESSRRAARAREVLVQLTSEYERAYYAGIIAERLGRARMKHRAADSGHVAYEHFRDAMECYQRAEPLRPSDDDDAILRWNSCARLLNESPHLTPRETEPLPPILGE